MAHSLFQLCTMQPVFVPCSLTIYLPNCITQFDRVRISQRHTFTFIIFISILTHGLVVFRALSCNQESNKMPGCDSFIFFVYIDRMYSLPRPHCLKKGSQLMFFPLLGCYILLLGYFDLLSQATLCTMGLRYKK